MSTDLQPFPGIPLVNVRRREIPCHCEAHCGEVVVQFDAQLPNGRPVAIMEDWRGFHLAIGNVKMLGLHPYSPPMSTAAIRKALQEAIG